MQSRTLAHVVQIARHSLRADKRFQDAPERGIISRVTVRARGAREMTD
ncbi:MAG TPA: hypothetical protein VHD36_17405 [Pirellulales bacterium]|nr:hypothetical protein [Pirellulales bacterium]